MSNISISNLSPTGSELFAGDENFMSELSENELASIAGGFDWEGDWCGTTKLTRTINPRTGPQPTPPVYQTPTAKLTADYLQ